MCVFPLNFHTKCLLRPAFFLQISTQNGSCDMSMCVSIAQARTKCASRSWDLLSPSVLSYVLANFKSNALLASIGLFGGGTIRKKIGTGRLVRVLVRVRVRVQYRCGTGPAHGYGRYGTGRVRGYRRSVHGYENRTHVPYPCPQRTVPTFERTKSDPYPNSGRSSSSQLNSNFPGLF